MKTIYFECSMGAAGDMLMAALLELHDNPEDFIARLNAVGIPKVKISAETSMKCGIKGTHVRVIIDGHEESGHDHHNHSHHDHDHDNHSHHGNDHHNHGHHHHHSSLHNIKHIIGHLKISEDIKINVMAVYKLIAEAESHAHGVPVNQIHFHEVGEMDAIADIVGVCMLIEELKPDLILASPVNVGSGHVRCSHGILPVPAPATAHIMRGAPIYNDEINGELCTPTGAAILKHFVKEFCKMPVITAKCIGYGMGTKDFKKANCVRAFLGESDQSVEKVTELVCNLDDMTPEAIAFAQQILMDEGALDAYTTPIGMKKGRAGQSLTCMCRIADRDKMMKLIFKHTTTLGMREYVSRRYTLQKKHHEAATPYGPIRMKTSSGFGITKSKPEFDDVAKIAKEQGLSIQEVDNNYKTKIEESIRQADAGKLISLTVEEMEILEDMDTDKAKEFLLARRREEGL